MSITEMSSNSAANNSNCILFEMRVLNDLRKLTVEQRKELLKTIENEEQLEEEALKKNPNLHLERKIQLILNEIKEMKQEMQTIQKNKDSSSSVNSNSAVCDFPSCSSRSGFIKDQPYPKCLSKCWLDVTLGGDAGIDSECENSVSNDSICSSIKSIWHNENMYWVLMVCLALFWILVNIDKSPPKVKYI